MKKTFTLVLLYLLAATGLMAQQKATLTIVPNSAQITLEPNNPPSVGQITKAGVELKFLMPNLDLTKLTSIAFRDNANNSVVSLSGSDLAGLATGLVFSIKINPDQTISGLAATLHVPFPFNVLVTYNGKISSSGLIGNPSASTGSAGPPPQVNPLTDGTKNTGVAFYDAMAISLLIKNNELAALRQYINTFYYPNATITTVADLQRVTADNPFFKVVFAQFNAIAGDKGSASPQAGPVSYLLSSVGNLDVTNLADGLAQFLVKRSQQELTVAFFDKFNQFINKYPDAKILFPETYGTLQNIGTNIYNYQAYLSSLRTSFEKDINGLLTHFPDVINSGTYATFFKAHGELKDACLSSIYIGNSLVQKEHPGQIIAGFDVNNLITAPKDQNIKAAVQTLQLFSQSLKSGNGNQYWIGTDSLNLLIKDTNALNLYLGILYQNADNISYTIDQKSQTLRSIMAAHASDLNAFETYIRGFVSQATAVSAAVSNVSGNAPAANFTDYYNLYNSSLDLIQYAQSASKLPGLNTLPQVTDFGVWINISRAGGNIALDISRKNYGSAMMSAYDIYNYAFGGDDGSLSLIAKNQSDTGAAKAAATLISDRKTMLNGQTDIIKKELLKYGTFIAAVSEAKSSADVESAIETIVLPAGSASVKRNTLFNISLNAYLGPYFGVEKIHSFDAKYTRTAGLTAPVGVAVSVGDKPFLFFLGGKSWSYSLFVSLIDVGALASYRLPQGAVATAAGDTAHAAQIPSIQLKNIVSPGAFLSIGIPKTPISISGGFEFGPNLRTVTTGPDNTVVNTYAEKLYTRWSVSLVVDLPLLNLFTKPN